MAEEGRRSSRTSMRERSSSSSSLLSTYDDGGTPSVPEILEEEVPLDAVVERRVPRALVARLLSLGARFITNTLL